MDVERRVHELETIARVSAIITGILNEAEMLHAVAHITRESFPEFLISIYLLQNDALELIQAQRDVESALDPRAYQISLKTERSLMSEAVFTKTSRIMDDIARRTSYDLLPFMPNARSEMVIPMLSGEHVIGVVNIQARTMGRFTEADIRVFKTLVDLIGVAIQNARFYEQGQQLAILEERNRMARELHDLVSQALYGIVLGSQTAQALLKNQKYPQLADTIDYVLSLAKAGLDEIRASIFDLRPLVLHERGLVDALKSHAHTLQIRHGIDVHLNLCEEPDIAFPVKEAIYRILREALHNIVKHAQATLVELEVECIGTGISFEVSDNGVGFDTTKHIEGSLGLKSMVERVTELEGELIIDSLPSKGTHITGFIPFHPPTQ